MNSKREKVVNFVGSVLHLPWKVDPESIIDLCVFHQNIFRKFLFSFDVQDGHVTVCDVVYGFNLEC